MAHPLQHFGKQRTFPYPGGRADQRENGQSARANPEEKLTIKGLPLSIRNKEVEDFLLSKNTELSSRVQKHRG